jgi:hypothetical protein
MRHFIRDSVPSELAGLANQVPWPSFARLDGSETRPYASCTGWVATVPARVSFSQDWFLGDGLGGTTAWGGLEVLLQGGVRLLRG